jgi:O-antigen/teichoic acid export membrane protein
VIEDPRVLYWCFPIVTLSSMLAHAQRYLSSKLLITTSNVIDFVSASSYLALLSVFFYLKSISIATVFLCWLLSVAIPFVGLVAYLWKDLLQSERIDWRYIPTALRFSMPSLVADYGSNVVGYFDRIAIGHYMTATSLGLYGFIYNLMNMAQVAARSVMDSLFTSYFLYAVKNKQRGLAQTALDVYLRWGSLAAFVVLIFFASYGQRFILLMSKPDMMPSYRYFFILWPLFIINMVTQIKSIHMNYVDEKRSKLIWCHLIIIPVTILMYMLSIKHFHLVGACIASTLTALFTYVVMSWYTRAFRVMPYLFHFKWSALSTLLFAAGLNKIISFEILKVSNNAFVVVMGGVVVTVTSIMAGLLMRLVSWNDKNRLSTELTAAALSIREGKPA